MNQDQILKLAEELQLPIPVKDIVAEQISRLPWERLSALIFNLTDQRYACEAQAQLAKLLAPYEKGSGMAQLTVMLASACRTRQKYEEKNLPDSVFLDTMGCFPRFLNETRLRTGKWIFDRAFWTWRQTAGCLFRLGTLEFEYCRAEEDTLPAAIKKGDMVISVHIPSDARLTESRLADSYKKMGCFFREHGENICPFGRPKAVVCSSWLLSSELLRLLKAESGIRRFAADYELFDEAFDREDCYEWLFAGKRELSELPENTSLQRTVKAHLLQGGKIGVASGLLKKRKELFV